MNHLNKQAPRVALITGAARRIGAAIVKHLHQAGFHVVIHCRSSVKEATDLAHDLNQQRKDSALVLTADLTIKNEVVALINDALAWQNRLDVLVNNASVFVKTDTRLEPPNHLGANIKKDARHPERSEGSPDTQEMSCHARHDVWEEQWDLLFSTNVKAPFWLSQTAYPFLAKTNGSIINITDIHAKRPLLDYPIYCQSKAALNMQTKTLAREFAPAVRVNAVAPGAIAWPEDENALSPELQEHIIAKTPLKQHGHPQFIAQAVLAFIDNPFITGQILAVDGGRSIG